MFAVKKKKCLKLNNRNKSSLFPTNDLKLGSSGKTYSQNYYVEKR